MSVFPSCELWPGAFRLMEPKLQSSLLADTMAGFLDVLANGLPLFYGGVDVLGRKVSSLQTPVRPLYYSPLIVPLFRTESPKRGRC